MTRAGALWMMGQQMIGTLSMIALVVLGFYGLSPTAIFAFALLNTLVGREPITVDLPDGAARCAGFARAYGLQLGFTAIGYGLGFAAAQILAAIG